MTTAHLHTIRRARERLGCDLSDDDVAVMEEEIRVGVARFVADRSSDASFFDVWTPSGVPCRVLFDTERGSIVTVLAAGACAGRRGATGSSRLTATVAEILRARGEGR